MGSDGLSAILVVFTLTSFLRYMESTPNTTTRELVYCIDERGA